MTGARRLVATVRFLVADLVRDQRVVIPVLLHLAVLGVVVGGDHTRAPGPWTASVLLLYPVTAWIGLTTAHLEEPDQRRVTTAAAGGPAVVTLATVVAALAVAAVPVVAGVLLPVLVNPAGFPGATLAAAALAHLAVACSGLALGTVCAPPVVARVGWSFALVTVVVLTTVGATWLPPVGVAADAVASASPDHVTSTLPALGATAALAVLLLGVAGLVSWAVARRA